MSMKVVFLKDSNNYKEGFEGFVSRQLGRRLCQQGITIPWSLKDYSPEYKAMVKRKKKEKAAKKPKQKPREKAVSKKVETREKAILE